MSRAFIKDDTPVENLPDRPISPHPNLVTPEGLALIDAAVNAARRNHAEAQAGGDRETIARAGRELRYWGARRASAELVRPDGSSDKVLFGSNVSIERDSGRRQTFKIVGEDEADPAKGTISHVSPLAVALLGKRVGDVINIGRDEAAITAIRSR